MMSNSIISGSRQFAPNKLPFNRLVKRIHFKATYIKQLEELDSGTLESAKIKITQKQKRADEYRQNQILEEKKRLSKYEERLNEVI